MHLRVDDLELYLRGGLSSADAAQLRCHLADCQACNQQLDQARDSLDQFAELSRSQSAQPSPAERRRAHRVPTNDPALLKLIYPNVSDPLPARILDVSQSGLKVEVPLLLEPGATVEILMGRAVAIAEVRYCVKVGATFHAGVLIQDVLGKASSY
jgi:anti-sigma factor RsiW